MASTFLPLTGKLGVWSHPVAQKWETRMLGRTGREVTSFGLAGGNKVQWELPGDEGVEIVVKGVRSGITYLETANNYQQSQRNYGKAFRILNLIPGQPGYDSNLRGRLFLATKTSLRTAIVRGDAKPVGGASSGMKLAIDDLKNSLTQFFGDGKGYIPDGAYIDLMQVHALVAPRDVEAAFEGYDNPADTSLPRIGVIAALRDFRDGSNLTGLNPEQKKYIRHIGITGHSNPYVHMDAMRRDTKNDLETLLVALNPNDKYFACHQYNSVPVAKAKNVGIIGMKIFADGVMYGLEKKFASRPGQSILTVGQSGKVSHEDLLRYTLSIDGVSSIITGIGLIDKSDDPKKDQLVANLLASQESKLSEKDRKRIEDEVSAKHGTDTNFFQHESRGLEAPQEVKIDRSSTGQLLVKWSTGFAAGEPIERYLVFRNGKRVHSMPFRPQLTNDPFDFIDRDPARGKAEYFVQVVDRAGRTANSKIVTL